MPLGKRAASPSSNLSAISLNRIRKKPENKAEPEKAIQCPRITPQRRNLSVTTAGQTHVCNRILS